MERFYQDLSRTVKQVHKRDVLLVMGDFNAKVGKSKPSAMSSAVGLYGLGETNEAGEQLEDFCLEHKLALANTVFKQHPRWLYTWTSPDDDIRNHIRLYFNCTKMENKLEELSRISRYRLRHRSSIICSWRRWKSGWLTDKNSTALRLWILRNLRKRKQYSLQQKWPTGLRHLWIAAVWPCRRKHSPMRSTVTLIHFPTLCLPKPLTFVGCYCVYKAVWNLA